MFLKFIYLKLYETTSEKTDVHVHVFPLFLLR